MKFYYFIISSILTLTVVNAQTNDLDPLATQDIEAQQKWVDSIYNSMTLKEKIGQLFMVQAFSNKDLKHENKIAELIKEHHIGGIIFSKGGPYRQAKLNNSLQHASKIPLLIGMDAEWGLSMRLDSTYAFPWNMTLGAVKDEKLIEKAGKHIGEHCKRLGVHFNFAPVVDINTNPNNPIIGNRSFGEDKLNVTTKSLAFMKGMQGAGVLANAKHFPGHGDTKDDSHKVLPTINFSEQRIDSIEIYPYKTLIKNGLSSVMVAHLNVPNLEPKSGIPSSLSETIISQKLKDSLGFKGLIFTDALTMKGVANFDDEVGAIDLAAFLAGNDVLLMSADVAIASQKLIEVYENKVFDEERLAHSVKKILKAKYKVGLNSYSPIGINGLSNDLNRLEDDLLYSQLISEAITVVQNQNDILPIKNLQTKKIAYVKMGDDVETDFINELKKYTQIDIVEAEKLDELLEQLKKYNTVIIGFHKSNVNPWKAYKLNEKEKVWLYEIARTNQVILDVFARPYALNDISTFKNFDAVVMSFQNSKLSQQKSAQIIFGALPAKGHLPVSINEDFKVGTGITFNSISRLSYGVPESVGMSSEKLAKLDSVAQHAVNEKMTPGIQLLVARKGKVIYNKNFGYHTYNKKQKVKDTDLYDVASLTKILATLPLVMELEQEGILSLNSKLGNLVPLYKDSNKKDVTILKMLSHYAKLKPWVPFYIKTLDTITKKPSNTYYKKEWSEKFSIKVANELYLRNDYQDSIQKIIRDTDLLEKLRYRYSDLPYYILKKYIENHYDKTLDELVQDHFYKSIGANYTTYNPLKKFSLDEIAPTEIDSYYRFQKVHGYVHDMGAAMQNGIGGHAGIFSNANDVAKLMQMYLQKGYYGGEQYFCTTTIDKFNKCHFCNKDVRRGVGFDKPELGDAGPTCGCLSMTSFGHSGFTGAYTWADPEEEIVYVFLANRTFPSAEINTLLRENIRTNIQELIYESIIE